MPLQSGTEQTPFQSHQPGGLAAACPATYYPEVPSGTLFPSDGLQHLTVALT